MPKKIPEQELEAIVAIVANQPDGVLVKTIRDRLEFDLPPRMLQRRLALLVEHKRLIVEGRGRGSCYKISPLVVEIHATTAKLTIKGHAAQVEIYPPISPEAEAIKQAVREPIQKRQPVGYNRAFLDGYRPNDTF